MPVVIKTFKEYFFYLEYRRRSVPLTIKSNQLALGYFALLYGDMDTEKLMPTHFVRFYHFLQNRKRQQKNEKDEYVSLSQYSVYKIMVKLRAYIRRLESERYLWDLKPIDVPVGGVPCPIPKYLTKEELKIILTYLEQRVQEVSDKKIEKYNAYLYRAIIRFLYTTWLRNTELRTLKMQDVNFDQSIGMVLWKGNKYGVITFSEAAKEKVEAYHTIRTQMFPHKAFSHVFTPYTDDTNKIITEQWLNKMVKNIGKSAGVNTKTNTHIYRHTLASHLVKDGYTLPEIRDKMRHSNVSVTNGYIHSNPVDQMTMTKNIDANISMDI